MRFSRPTSSLFALPLLLMAGCSYEQSLPPTPEGLVLIKARTAVGTVATKVEARPMTLPPRAGEVSIWSIKVFDIKDKPSGERKEWKFFNQLPQNTSDGGTTDVLMRAWIISKDRTTFLPQTPSYKAYGSFVTDWTMPKAGNYSLFVQYQPVALSDPDDRNSPAERSVTLSMEMARWDFEAVPNSSEASTTPAAVKSTVKPVFKDGKTLYELRSSSSKSAEGPQVLLSHRSNPKAGEYLDIEFESKDKQTLSTHEVSALSPDGKTLLHFVGDSGKMVFSQKGQWDVWLSFKKDGEKFISHGNINIS
jgi:hypothetical protein